MKFSVTTALPSSPVVLDVGSCVMTMGSCFAQHIGTRLSDALPEGQVEVNPFGVTYNPASMSRCLQLLLKGELPVGECLFHGRDGLWHSWLHATPGFSAPTREACLNNITKRFETARERLQAVDVVMLTFGTAHVYELSDTTHLTVNNCHKEPPVRFVERRLTVEEIVGLFTPVLQELRRQRPGLQVVLTVSPYRYTKLGLHGSTLSKSILHLACEALGETFDFVKYFPAYEIIIDELRDYRFYERDMLHPSAVAVDYVWERFAEWSFTPQLERYAALKSARLKRERHVESHRAVT